MSIARTSQDPRSISHHALIIHNQMPMLNFFSTSLNHFNGNSPMINHFNDVLKKFIIRRFHNNRMCSATAHAPSNHSTTMRRLASISNTTSSTSHDSVKKLFDTFNSMYIRGRIPNQNRSNLRPFNGFITDDLANKITMWLAQMPEPQNLPYLSFHSSHPFHLIISRGHFSFANWNHFEQLRA